MTTRLSKAVREAAAKEARRGGQNALARRAGIDKAILSRFLNGGGLSLTSLDRLVVTLGFAVVVKGGK